MGYRAHGSVDQSSSVVVTLDIDLALDLWSSSVGDVDDGVLHEILYAGVGVGVLLLSRVADGDFFRHQFPQRVIDWKVPVVYRGGDDESVAIKHHLHRIALHAHVGLERQFAELGDTHNHQQVAVEHVDVVAVGLQEVGLVDAILLVVGLGVLTFVASVVGV